MLYGITFLTEMFFSRFSPCMIQIHNNYNTINLLLGYLMGPNSKANVPPNPQRATMKNLNFEAVLATILCYRQIKQYYCFQRKKSSRKRCTSMDAS